MPKRGRGPNSGYNSVNSSGNNSGNGYNSEPNAKRQELRYSVEDLEYDIENIQRERYDGPGNQLGMPQHLGGILYKIGEIRKRAAVLDDKDEEVKKLLSELDTLEKQTESGRKTWINDIAGDDRNYNSNGYNSNATIPASPGGGRRKTRRQRSRKNKSKSRRR